jgi:hypothetical protein
MQFVPVVDKNQIPLMPTTSARARRWIRSGKATPFWKRGVFCVRLNMEVKNLLGVRKNVSNYLFCSRRYQSKNCGYMDKPTKKQPNRKVISLHCPLTGKRLTQNALPQDLKFLTYNTWRLALPPTVKTGVSAPRKR